MPTIAKETYRPQMESVQAVVEFEPIPQVRASQEWDAFCEYHDISQMASSLGGWWDRVGGYVGDATHVMYCNGTIVGLIKIDDSD